MLPLVITIDGVHGAARRYAFADSPVTIGRSPFAELQLTEPFVSRWEGTLRFDDHEVTYFGLGSTNAAYLNNREVTGQQEDIALDADSVLRIGELQLRFSREPVPEADLRRKGKRVPSRDDPQVAVKTVYLDAGLVIAQPPAPPAALPSPSLPPIEAPEPKLARELPVRAREASAGDQETLRGAYRAARDALVAQLLTSFEHLPSQERAAWVDALVRSEPELALAPELAAAFGRAGVARTDSDIPELRAWLQDIGRDVLPSNLHIDTTLTLTRVLGLLEALTQSLAEINDAQDAVRKRWLGRASRRSVLKSDNGRIVLAYLLNPQADWDERLRELEQSIRDVVTHELALFKAMLEGARTLVEALSPEALARAEGVPLPSLESGAAKQGFWNRVRGDEVPASKLWGRLVGAHEALMDGERYQRVFLGRWFARRYLAAMGQHEPQEATASVAAGGTT